MSLNWNLVLDGQLGFNQPQTETGRFSLRSELFRIQAGTAGSRVWRDTLTRNVVPNLLELPEFKRSVLDSALTHYQFSIVHYQLSLNLRRP